MSDFFFLFTLFCFLYTFYCSDRSFCILHYLVIYTDVTVWQTKMHLFAAYLFPVYIICFPSGCFPVFLWKKNILIYQSNTNCFSTGPSHPFKSEHFGSGFFFLLWGFFLYSTLGDVVHTRSQPASLTHVKIWHWTSLKCSFHFNKRNNGMEPDQNLLPTFNNFYRSKVWCLLWFQNSSFWGLKNLIHSNLTQVGFS